MPSKPNGQKIKEKKGGTTRNTVWGPVGMVKKQPKTSRQNLSIKRINREMERLHSKTTK